MRISIEMENLSKIIEDAVAENTKEVIEDYVAQKTKSVLEEKYKDFIHTYIHDMLEKYVTDYIENFEITVGGGLDDTSIKTYTPRTYINKLISDTFTSQSFTTTTENCYGRKETKKVTFEEFIKQFCDPELRIKAHMENFGRQLSNQVNHLIKNEYDKSLQNALSGVILDVIMENEAFKNVNDNIRRLSE